MPTRDPQRLTLLARQFALDILKRFAVLDRELRNLIDTLDAFGLKGPQQGSPFTFNAEPKQFAFQTSPQKLASFRAWLQDQVDKGLLQVEGDGKPWASKYIDSAYKKGLARAYIDSKKTKLKKPLDFTQQNVQQFLQSAFAQPEKLSKIQFLATRTFTELEGVTAKMAQDMNRILAAGMAAGENPKQIARTMSKSINKLSKNRALLIARTELAAAHAEGQLDAFEDLGVDELGLEAEWSTAGDDRVCPICAPNEGQVFSVKEARGLIPAHPNCRCAWLPATEATKKLTKKKAKKAIEDGDLPSLPLPPGASDELKKLKDEWEALPKGPAKKQAYIAYRLQRAKETGEALPTWLQKLADKKNKVPGAVVKKAPPKKVAPTPKPTITPPPPLTDVDSILPPLTDVDSILQKKVTDMTAAEWNKAFAAKGQYVMQKKLAEDLGIQNVFLVGNTKGSFEQIQTIMSQYERVFTEFKLPKMSKMVKQLELHAGTKVKKNNALGSYHNKTKVLKTNLGVKKHYINTYSPGEGWNFKVAQGIEQTAVHELGHGVHLNGFSKKVEAQWDLLYYKLTSDNPSYKAAYGSSKDFFKKKVSGYAATNHREAFAESFAAWVHPSYKKGDLPPPIEDFLQLHVPKKKLKAKTKKKIVSKKATAKVAPKPKPGAVKKKKPKAVAKKDALHAHPDVKAAYNKWQSLPAGSKEKKEAYKIYRVLRAKHNPSDVLPANLQGFSDKFFGIKTP